jgi:hypothetical protein
MSDEPEAGPPHTDPSAGNTAPDKKKKKSRPRSWAPWPVSRSGSW